MKSIVVMRACACRILSQSAEPETGGTLTNGATRHMTHVRSKLLLALLSARKHKRGFTMPRICACETQSYSLVADFEQGFKPGACCPAANVLRCCCHNEATAFAEPCSAHLRVWDLKHEGRSNAEIARLIFPKYSPDSALSRVRDHLKAANKLISGHYREIR